jgi:branched-subunit amino acid aminotransferase/4-amino-4-deoxychorismate lyase
VIFLLQYLELAEHMKSVCYINGEIKSTNDGVIGITDLALQRGYGIFDFGRTYNGKLFHFEDNIKRFRRSASELHLSPPISDEKIGEIAAELIEESDLRIPSVRLLLTGGYSPTLEQPNFIIIAEELPTYPSEIYSNGAKIMTVEFQRELPHVKSINYLNSIRLEPLKREKKAFDILYHSQVGITECPRNNFFAFFGDTLVTPSDHVLHGITRKHILRLAANRFATEERMMSVEELDNIDEAFITSTSMRVLPISQIDDREIGNGPVGDRTKTVMRLFDDYTREY